MREKLIELLFVGQVLADAECDKQTECNKCQYNAPNACRVGFIADHLIANGVTIPRIPVGSTVYCLYSRQKYRGTNGKTKTSNHQIVTQKSLLYKLACGVVEIREKKANKQDVLLLGKLVFRSREEAEAAIAPKTALPPKGE